MDAGIDPRTELIPVAPAAHYHMGGIATDLRGRTTVEGLWAAGEVASTGLHGANRLASNSLLEAVVFGARVAADIRGLVSQARAAPIAKTYRVDDDSTADKIRRAALVARLRRTMTEHAGVIRDARGLETALSVLRDIEEQAGADSMVANMAIAGQLVAGAALLRKESRGAHFRADYPAPNPALAKRSIVTLARVADIETRGRKAGSATLIAGLPL